MTPKTVCAVTTLLLVLLSGETSADFLVYRLGTKGKKPQPRGQGTRGIPSAAPQRRDMNLAGTGASAAGRQVVLYGKIKKEGGQVMYTHPEVGEPLLFQPNQVTIKHAPTIRMAFNKMLGRAGKDPEAVMEAALWALKKGLLGEFHHGVENVLALNPQDERALRIRELKKKIDAPLPDQDNSAIEKRLRNIVTVPGMQVATSDHFILLYDTNAKAEHGHHLNRAKERLHLLEQMYERFVLLFEAQGADLDLPRERLMVALFKNYADFQECAARLDPGLAGVAGFWNPVHNITCFYDDSTTAESRDLHEERDKLEKIAADAKKSGSSLEKQHDSETLRQIKINNVLLEIDRLNSDIANVSREVSHQLAANTGLLPRRVVIPRWLDAGLAMYFEAPSDEAWGGVGAVDDLRIEQYRALKDDRLRSNIDVIIEDQSLDRRAPRSSRPVAAAQVWALTHFLFENHVQEFVAYFKLLGRMPPDVTLNADLLGELFSQAFGSDHAALQQEWRSYMRTLKSDVERMEESETSD